MEDESDGDTSCTWSTLNIPKEIKKIDKYLDLARDLKKLWMMRVTVIPVVLGALGTFLKKSKRKTNTWILCYIVIYTFIQHHNDTIIKTHEGRKTQEELRCRKEDTRRLL